MSSIWQLNTTVRARPEASFPGPADANIYVECLVPAIQLEDALRGARARFEEELYELIEVWRAVQFDLDNWDFEAFPFGGEIWELVEQIVESNRIRLGAFIYGSKS